MKGYFVVLALLGLTSGAPQNWPYRDSLMPYRYGYPSPSQYKYLPQIEDDEDVGPYLGRQDFAVVGSDGDRVRPTTEAVVPGVIETGSVAPVVEPSKEPPKIPSVPSPPPPRPVGPEQGVGKPVQPPPFPPARPPPTPPPKEEEEEDEDEDDDESDEADDEETGDDDNEEGNKDNEDEDDDEERRRQEPLSEEKVDEVNPVVVDQTGTAAVPAVPSAPAPVVEQPVVSNTKPKEPEPSSVEEVNAPPSVESNEVVKPTETDDESEEVDDSIEALVPGYVTDQGEVLVPVDTVTGDQPISIVPDPYTPPTRGVPINGASNFRFSNYNNNPYYYPDIYEDELGLGRQDSDDDTDDDENTIEDNDNEEEDDGDDDDVPSEDGPEGRNEFLTAFPPARTPELYAVINSRIPDSQEVNSYGPQGFSQQEEFGPVVAYRVKQATVQRPSVSVAVALNQGSQTTQQPQPQYIQNPYIMQALRNPYMSQQVRNPYIGQFIRRKPIRPQIRRNPYAGPYAPYFKPQIRSPYPGHHMPSPYVNQYFPNAYINRFVNRPPFNPYDFQGPRPSQGIRSPGPRPIRRPIYPKPSPFGGYGPRPVFGPQGYTQAKPVFINRRPGLKPVGLTTTANKVVVIQKNKKPQPLKSSVVTSKRPTPVVHQDDFSPYIFENPQAYHQVSQSSSESNESNDYVQDVQFLPEGPKTRRAAKMAKKETKKSKLAEKQKKDGNPDPLNILKKVSSKKA